MSKRERMEDIIDILIAVETLHYLDRNLLVDLGGANCNRQVREYLCELKRLNKS